MVEFYCWVWLIHLGVSEWWSSGWCQISSPSDNQTEEEGACPHGPPGGEGNYVRAWRGGGQLRWGDIWDPEWTQWCLQWYGRGHGQRAAAGAAGEGTGNASAASHGRGVSPHAQTAARITCPRVLPRSHLWNHAKMKVRLTNSGMESDSGRVLCILNLLQSLVIQEISCHFIYPTTTRQPTF